jgi:hypothetical protein
MPGRPRAAIDATGLEARHASRHYYPRAGKEARRSGRPKLSAVTDAHTHPFLPAVVGRGPGHDAGQFRPAVGAAAGRVPIDTPPGDAASDGESHHAHARDELGIRSTTFPVYRRGGGGGPARGRYRRQVVRRFRPKPAGSGSKRVYGQRWQAESVFGRHKRLLGSAPRARRWDNQVSETLLRVVVHDLMLLAAA